MRVFNLNALKIWNVGLFVLAMLLSLNLAAQPSLVLDNLHQKGQGKMQVYFWDVYQAAFYLPDQTASLDSYPQALKINYLRDIKKADLIKATDEQWQHIGLNNSKQADWLKLLADIWPDISKFDTLVLQVEQDGLSRFFYQKNGDSEYVWLADMTDPEFGESFLAIWLSPKTSRPELRQQLLGLANSK